MEEPLNCEVFFSNFSAGNSPSLLESGFFPLLFPFREFFGPFFHGLPQYADFSGNHQAFSQPPREKNSGLFPFLSFAPLSTDYVTFFLSVVSDRHPFFKFLTLFFPHILLRPLPFCAAPSH